jgi:hypothetical protein
MADRRGRTLETNVSRILKTLDVAPRRQTSAATLVVTVGLPGSGKSTFARRLARETGATVLESDALRRLLFGIPVYSALESRRLFEAINASARELLEHGRDVIIDATNVRESDRLPIYALAEATGSRLLLLSFTADSPVIESRLRARSSGTHVTDSSTAGLAIYHMLAERAEPLTREHWIIDTTNPDDTDVTFRRVVEACRPLTAGKPGMGGTS